MPEREAIILGAGPAGCSAAVKLASLGRRVTVFVRAGRRLAVPRLETIHDPALLHEAFEGYRPGRRTWLDLARRGMSWWTGEGEPTRPVAVLDRAGLDADLLSHLRARGIEVVEFGGDAAVSLQEEVQGWKVRVSDEEWRAPFLIDASGRHSSLRKRRDLVTWRQTGTLGEVTGEGLPPLWTESLPCGWLWGIQWEERRWLLGAFGDPGKTTRAALMRSSRFSSRLHDWPDSTWTTNTAPVSVSAVCQRSIIHIGDAALSRDPLATQGIVAAVSDGLCAAIAVHTLLGDQASRALVAQFLEQRHQLAVRRHVGFLSQSYGAAPFSTAYWRERSQADARSTPATSEGRGWGGDFDEPLALSGRWRLEARPVLDAHRIRTAVCLCSDDEVVSWLGGHAIDELLHPAREAPATARSMMSWWSTGCGVSETSRLDVLRWLTIRQILVPAGPLRSSPAFSLSS